MCTQAAEAYSVREFRKELSNALDQCDKGEDVKVRRGDSVYTVKVEGAKCVHSEIKTVVGLESVGEEIKFEEEVQPVIIERPDPLKYSCCGRAKKPGKYLCEEHHRA